MPSAYSHRRLGAVLLGTLTAVACRTAGPTTEPPPRMTDSATVPSEAPAPASAPPVRVARAQGAERGGPRRIGKCEVKHEGSSLPGGQPRPPSAATVPVNYARFRQRRVIHVGHSHLSIAHFAHDAKTLLAVSESEAALRLYDALSGKLLAKHAVKGYEQFGRGDFEFFDPEHPTRVIFAHDHGLELLDAVTGEHHRTLTDQGAWDIEWSDGGHVLMATLPELNTQTSKLALYTRTHEGGLALALLLACPERIDGMALDAAGRRLALSHYPANEISLLDLQTGDSILRVRGPAYARSVALSPDSELLAVGGDAVWLFGVESGSERQAQHTRFDNNVHQVHFSPNGKVIAASAYDGRARLLEFVPGQPELRLVRELRHGGTANVYAAAFSRDGRLLLTSSGDRTLRIWGE